MIKLKSIIGEVHENIMWTYKDAKPIADSIGGKVVGSVKTKGSSKHDLDIKVYKYTRDIARTFYGMGYRDIGSQIVSPKEIRRSGKFGRNDRFWLRSHGFMNYDNGKMIEVWSVEHDEIINVNDI